MYMLLAKILTAKKRMIAFLIVLTDLEDNNFEKVEIVLNGVGI